MFNKEQLEALIITIKENISLAESLLKTEEYGDVEAVKDMIASQEKTLEDYTQRLEKIKVGRPSIGATKKVSLTLTEENWELFDGKAEGNRSKFLRGIVGDVLGLGVTIEKIIEPKYEYLMVEDELEVFSEVSGRLTSESLKKGKSQTIEVFLIKELHIMIIAFFWDGKVVEHLSFGYMSKQ